MYRELRKHSNRCDPELNQRGEILDQTLSTKLSVQFRRVVLEQGELLLKLAQYSHDLLRGVVEFGILLQVKFSTCSQHSNERRSDI